VRWPIDPLGSDKLGDQSNTFTSFHSVWTGLHLPNHQVGWSISLLHVLAQFDPLNKLRMERGMLHFYIAIESLKLYNSTDMKYIQPGVTLATSFNLGSSSLYRVLQSCGHFIVHLPTTRAAGCRRYLAFFESCRGQGRHETKEDAREVE
jgi:hypothetical protein